MIDRTLNYGREIIRRFVDACDPVDILVDIGAGQGDDLRTAQAAKPRASCHAIEWYGPNAEKLASMGFKVHRLNIERDRFPFENEKVDLVMANQILEHTKEIFWILDQVSRVLRVGGHFIAGVPNLAALHNRLLLAAGRQPTSLKNNSAHLRGFTKTDVVNLLESAFPGGFRLRQFAGGNFYPFPPVIARPLAKLLPNMAWAIFFDFQKMRPYQGEFVEFPRRMQLETNFHLGEVL